MTSTLATARQALVSAIAQDTPGSDRPRLIAVLDALIAWSLARPNVLAFRATDGSSPLVRFELKQRSVVLWAARLTRGIGPQLEICPPTGRALSDADRALGMQTLNTYSRQQLVEGERLHISFAALKNDSARTAVLELLDRILESVSQPRSTAGTIA